MTRPTHEVLQALDEPTLLVVGDLILDRYVVGTVERVSPEAPIQVLRVEEETERLGAAGFTAQNVAVLGGRALLLGVVGDDVAGARVEALAREAGVAARLVVAAERRTSVKTRHLAHSHSTSQQVLRVDRESTTALDADAAARFLETFTAHLEAADAVLVNDYGKGALAPATLATMIAAARARGVPVVVDPHKGNDFTRYRGATCLTPNRAETETASRRSVRTTDEAAAAAAVLLEELELELVLLTLDRDGMLLRARGGAPVPLRTTPREVFDVTGAGDVVLSAFGLALASGAAPAEAAQLANVAAGLEVEHVGVVPISRADIAARLAVGGRDAASKVLDRAEAHALGTRLRGAGKRIVFTNGCFDLLHAGHVRYLAEARALGDVLVVGLNTDASVRRLKGPDRPLHRLEDRATVLAALAAVDHVIPFEEDDEPLALIGDVLPDVLVKGADWAGKGVVGRDVVEARGGQVVLIDLLAGRSTSATVARIRDIEGA